MKNLQHIQKKMNLITMQRVGFISLWGLPTQVSKDGKSKEGDNGMTKLWGGRFTKRPEQWIDEFGASISFDQHLVEEDIEGSLAHVTMLEKCAFFLEMKRYKLKKAFKHCLKKLRRKN